MSFIQPAWLLLTLILPFILLGAILSRLRQGRAWRALVAPRLRPRLVRESGSIRHWISLTLALLGASCLIAAIARPSNGETSTTEEIKSRNILIAIDTSRSMLTEDSNPNRLAAAKTIAIDLLERFPNDRIGLVAFSGTSVLVAPLTIDHAAVHSTVSQLDTRIIPSGGSNITAAIETSLKTFGTSNSASSALIIISDGEDHTDKTAQAASRIRNSGITVCSIGVGTQHGGVIPDYSSPDGKFRDARGQTVLSQMNPSALTELARAGNGSFVTAEFGATHAIQKALESLHANRQETRTITTPHEAYAWFLIPGLALLIASLIVRSRFTNPMKPPVALQAQAAALFFILLTHNSLAETSAQAADEAYRAGDFTKAETLFKDALEQAQGEDRHALEFSLGSTAYRQKDWSTASRHFSQALNSTNPTLQKEVHYNLANTLFQKAWIKIKPTAPEAQPEIAVAITHLEDCIGHYRATLKQNPDHSAAKHNIALAEKLLEQLKKQQKKQKQQDKKSDQGKPKQKKQGDNKKPEDKPDQPEDKQGDGKPDKDGKSPKKGDKPSDKKQEPGEPNKDGEPKKKPQPEGKPDLKRRDGETPEAQAARILKDHSDSETRPVQRRLLRLRRPFKDW